MTINPNKKLPPLSQAAFELETDIADLERLCEQLEGIPVDSDGNMNHARKLLGKFGETATKVANGVQDLSTALHEARARAESASSRVGQSVQAVQARQEQADTVTARFQNIIEKVRTISTAMAEMQKPLNDVQTAEEKTFILKHSQNFDGELLPVIEDLRQIKAEANAANMKSLERDADAMAQSLNAARQKLLSLSEKVAVSLN